MIKGLNGLSGSDTLRIPIIENTSCEYELKVPFGKAISENPDVGAILVRSHGVYVWGHDWKEAKIQSECLDYLFTAAIKMYELGLKKYG